VGSGQQQQPQPLAPQLLPVRARHPRQPASPQVAVGKVGCAALPAPPPVACCEMAAIGEGNSELRHAKICTGRGARTHEGEAMGAPSEGSGPEERRRAAPVRLCSGCALSSASRA
jgi:hypothetical protein